MKVVQWLLILGVLVLNAMAVPGLLANPLRTDGQVISLKGVDDFGATGDHYYRSLITPGLAAALGGAGVVSLASGYMGTGITALGSGVVAAFWPSITGSMQDQAAAATLGAMVMHSSPSFWFDWLGSTIAHAAPIAMVVSWLRTRKRG